MLIKETKDLIVRYYEECNAIKGDPTKFAAVIVAFFAPNFIGHAPTGDINFEQHKHHRAALYTAFPDLKWTIEDMIAEGDKAVVRFSASGTQKGAFQGIPPTERLINITGVAIYRIAGGKFLEDWAFMDTLGVMRQLGLNPRP
jgi:predicted ester cyclase